jgi:ABC-2 type transport system permease protein
MHGRQALRGGGYSIVVSLIVLALIIVVNVLVSALPATATKYDISATQLYSITSNTKVVVNALDKDVNIYWVVQSGQEDSVIENLLAKYESLSDHIKVSKKNPDVFPTFTEQYTDEEVYNNSLIVECGDKSRYIAYDDIYLQETDMYSYSYTTAFDGEGAITSAIDYVVSEELPIAYVLEGHGETALPATFGDQMAKDNIEVSSLSLLTVDAIPDDAACLVIYAPASDISSEEQEMLSDYVAGGGKLLVMAGPTEESSLTNLHTILSAYGVSQVDGVVIEGDRERYAFQMPYILIPEMASGTITDSLMDAGYTPILPIAQGLNTDSAGEEVTAFLTTSASSFSKIAGYNLDTYEKEEGDTDGPFALGVSIADASGGQIICFSSSYFLDDMYNSYSSGANGDLAMNAISSLIGDSESMAIRSKSLNYNYLTINEATSSLLKVVMIGVCPLLYLGIGIYVIMNRRRRQNETV